jgi:hypothetical protein
MTITVYRWQDKDGRGPYRPGTTQFWADADNQAKNPAFYREFGMDIVWQRRPREVLGCAFRTIEQMNRWFTEDEQLRMRLLGYEFGTLEADRILAESERQLVFACRRPLTDDFHAIEAEQTSSTVPR